jgi:hypothetical protein
MAEKSLTSTRCLVTDEVDGISVICFRSKGHDQARDAKKAMHYDPDAELYFGAKGQIEIEISVPGQDAPIVLTEGLPKGWANMTEDQRRSHLAWREEDTKDMIEISAEYNHQA